MKPKLLTTLKGYTLPALLADSLAGVTVAMVALPLSIAIAIASGVPPSAGIVTAIVGGLVISLLGGSRVQIGGPTGAFIVIVYGIVEAHGVAGLVTATLLAGIILLVAAVLHAGRLVAIVPEPVVDGFTIGIAIVIAASQFGDLFGLNVHLPADFLPKLAALWAARDGASLAALGVGVVAMGLIVGLRRAAPRAPGLIVAVALVSGAVAWFGLPVATVAARYGALAATLPAPTLPVLDPATIVALLPSALVIAFLAGIESLLSARVADRMIGGAHRPDAELLAQGAANLASALFGGLPATGAIARTATNVRAGGRTPVAGIVAALAILVVMAVAAPLAGQLALPALAGLLLLTAWNMSEPARWRERLAAPFRDRVLIVLTLLLTVLVDLTVAIAVGTLAGVIWRAPSPPPSRT
ncbi:sulfate permease [alpha proteobacterium AAP81b]|nr:sulfate permease [alpha proteobacterium AAP81b]